MSLTPKLLQQGAAGSARPVYIEDVFSTYLYTGNSGVRVISNDIDLLGKGGLVWTKSRSASADHALVDTARGVNNLLRSNTTAAQQSVTSITQFNSNGYNLYDPTVGLLNNSGTTYTSWTFRKQPKFFDIVTYTGNGSAPRNINHNLGSIPGCIMIKRTDTTSTWTVYHAGIGNTKALFLNADAATDTNSAYWNNTTPTSTVFTLGGTFSDINASGGTYVAYLFANNAGGFGLTGSDNVISCGSYTGNGLADGPIITLGYEPQWVMIKRTDSTGNWWMMDIMRGMSQTDSLELQANASTGDLTDGASYARPLATGFSPGISYAGVNASGGTYIYIAIRRGPMKVPTTGTSVFSPITTSAATNTTQTTNFPIDSQWQGPRGGGYVATIVDRLRGNSSTPSNTAAWPTLITLGTGAENTASFQDSNNWNNTGFDIASLFGGSSTVYWSFRRAPNFFDEVCYTGTGSATTFSHNLGVTPELMIVKIRNAVGSWYVYHSALGSATYITLNGLGSSQPSTAIWNNTSPTSSVFSVGSVSSVNGSGSTYVAYLFASCPGVSKVGSYTGNGSTQTIDCGFAAGARFVLIKRTDSTGDWYTFDTARGIIAGNDPFLKLNTTDAEVTSYDAVDPANSGFIVNNDATNYPINVSSATYIFLAIA